MLNGKLYRYEHLNNEEGVYNEDRKKLISGHTPQSDEYLNQQLRKITRTSKKKN